MAGNPVDPAYEDAIAVTPSDTVVYSPPLRALYVGTASTATLTVVTGAGNTVEFGNVAPGVFPIICISVKSTGTTATNIVGFR